MGTDKVENALSERSLSRRGFAKSLGTAVLGTTVGVPLIGAAQAEAAGGTEGLNPTAVKTSAYTAASGDYVPVNIEHGSVAIKLPSAPLDKTRIGIQVVAVSGTPGSTTVTINRGGSDVFNIAGGSTSLTLLAKFQSVLLQYHAGIWYVQSTDTPMSQALGSAQLGNDATVGGEGGSALSSSVVYTSGAILLHPETFGATPSGDSTAAFIAMTEHIEAKKYGNVAILLGAEYYLNSVPIHTHGGNAIWPWGKHGATSCNVEIVCAPGGTAFFSTLTGQSYSSSYGCPSMMGGPTNEQLGSNFNFGAWNVTIRGALTLFPCWGSENPTVCGLDAERCPIFIVRGSIAVNVSASSEGTGPSHTYQFGLRLPEGGSSGQIIIENVYAQGCYTGIVANSAHLCANLINIQLCRVALGVIGNEQLDINDGHNGTIQHLLTQACNYDISGWAPTQAGPMSIPSGKPACLVVDLFDTEDDRGWCETKLNILDANNELYMRSTYQRYEGILLVEGARQCDLWDSKKRWEEIAYYATYTDASGVGQPTACRREGNRVFLRGGVWTLQEISSGNLVCKLPYGPPNRATFAVAYTNLAQSTYAAIHLIIEPNGEVYMKREAEAERCPAERSILLDGIHFNLA